MKSKSWNLIEDIEKTRFKKQIAKPDIHVQSWAVPINPIVFLDK